MKSKFLGLLLALALAVGSAGISYALPILNDGNTVAVQLNDKGEVYGDYVNSGNLMFVAPGNNDGSHLAEVEALVESYLSLPDSFELIATGVNYSSADGGYTGTWQAMR